MTEKIKKLREDYARTAEKIASLQEKNKALAEKIHKLEDAAIIGAIRSNGMNIDELMVLLERNGIVSVKKMEEVENEN